MSKDIRTKAFVLRRTNYGEADRILNLLTENGMIAVIAKGVRKEKSKLAGGIELFCLCEITYHEGKNNSLGVLTSAKMLQFFDRIPVDLARLELGSMVLKQIGKVAENIEGGDYFNLLYQVLVGLNESENLTLIEAWFWLNFANISGEQINLYRDVMGEDLLPDMTYVWDAREGALRAKVGGNIGENEIKLMRLMVTADLNTVLRVEKVEPLVHSVLHLAKAVNKV